jgi:hypothetical protein
MVTYIETLTSDKTKQIELAKTFFDLIQNSIKNNNSTGSNLVSCDWQVSLIERENEKLSINCNKMDKVVIDFQFKHFDSKISQHKSSLIKLNYNEFNEIYQNLKKIDGQLHLFKN